MPDEGSRNSKFLRFFRQYVGWYGAWIVLLVFVSTFLFSVHSTSEEQLFTSTVSYGEDITLHKVARILFNFEDISDTDWFYEYLFELVSEGIIDGSKSAFLPDDYLNRAELVKIVMLALDADLIEPSSPTFEDVQSDAWYFPYVETAASLGIVEGYRNADGDLTGYFGPADTVNRAQAVKVLVSAFHIDITDSDTTSFPDVETGEWYAPYVATAFSNDIVSGYENGNFGPANPVTRAEIVKIVVKSEEVMTPASDPDNDNDGFTIEEDCDDTDDSVHPDASETCGDGIDQNCSGADLSCDDVDNDGDSYTENEGDCDDTDDSVSPDADEICGDGVDQDCSGADLSCDDVDNDGDSYTENEGDCDDTDSTVYPSAPEICGDEIDQNCNGSDLTCDAIDDDGDGYSEAEGDCDDTSSSVYPGASEIPYSGVDEDCDSSTRDDDLDRDGYRVASDCDDSDDSVSPDADEICGDGVDQDCSGADLSCDDVDNDGDSYTENKGDCDDTKASVHPKASETCGDGVDQDCSGADLSCDDVDNDGDSYTENKGDCDDSDDSVSPDADEICGDGVDQDCSGADLSCDDVDNDGDSYTENKGDCDDSLASVHPKASETCGDGIDQDCNGSDLECEPADQDGDGYSEAEGDCDDSSSAVHPKASETCGDGVDQDCNGKDLECEPTDQDGDGYSEAEGDCDDSLASVHPKASETCGDSVDQDCSGADLSCSGVDRDVDGFTSDDGDCDDTAAGTYPRAYEICGDGIDQDCDGSDLSCSENPCDSIDSVNEDVCGAYYTSSGEYVCACPVTAASASDPFCEKPTDTSAQYYFSSAYSDDIYEYHYWGNKFIPYNIYFGTVSFNGNSISYDELGSMDNFLGTCNDAKKEDCQYYDWIEAVPSPDTEFLAVYEQAANLMDDDDESNDDDVTGIDKKARYAGLMQCKSGSDPGFRVDHILQYLTAPMVRWGAQVDSLRTLYAMSNNMYHYYFSSETVPVTTSLGGSDAVNALIIQGVDKLGNSPEAFADFDVTSDPAYPTYAVFLEGMSKEDALYEYDGWTVPTRINVMDLSDCDLDRCRDEADGKFCCKTAVLVENSLAFWPTNPGLYKNGDYIGFNRFGAKFGYFGDIYDQYYVMKNPFEFDLLGSCDTSGNQDGFTEPIDCTSLISHDDGTFDYNACPNYSCCGAVDGVDCSICTSMGRSNYDGDVICNDDSDDFRVLNWTVFIRQGGKDYLTFLSTTGGDGNSELDLYEITLSGDQFIPRNPGSFPLTRIDVMEYEVSPGSTIYKFIPAPFNR